MLQLLLAFDVHFNKLCCHPNRQDEKQTRPDDTAENHRDTCHRRGERRGRTRRGNFATASTAAGDIERKHLADKVGEQKSEKLASRRAIFHPTTGEWEWHRHHFHADHKAQRLIHHRGQPVQHDARSALDLIRTSAEELSWNADNRQIQEGGAIAARDTNVGDSQVDDWLLHAAILRKVWHDTESKLRCGRLNVVHCIDWVGVIDAQKAAREEQTIEELPNPFAAFNDPLQRQAREGEMKIWWETSFLILKTSTKQYFKTISHKNLITFSKNKKNGVGTFSSLIKLKDHKNGFCWVRSRSSATFSCAHLQVVAVHITNTSLTSIYIQLSLVVAHISRKFPACLLFSSFVMW